MELLVALVGVCPLRNHENLTGSTIDGSYLYVDIKHHTMVAIIPHLLSKEYFGFSRFTLQGSGRARNYDFHKVPILLSKL